MEPLALIFVLTVGLLSPGPDFLLVVKNSALGPARGYGTVAGIGLGLALQNAVLALGFGWVAAGDPPWLTGARWAGAAVLGFMGWRALVVPLPPPPPRAANEAARPEADGWGRGFRDGLLINLTNPKAFLFFVSLHAQVADAAQLDRLLLGALITVHGLVCWALLVRFLRLEAVARTLARYQAILLRAFGLGLLALAVVLIT